MKLKIILLLRLKKKNWLAKYGKYIACLDYFDKSLIVLSVATGSISITSFTRVIRAPMGMTSASFSLAFSYFTGIVKNC